MKLPCLGGDKSVLFGTVLVEFGIEENHLHSVDDLSLLVAVVYPECGRRYTSMGAVLFPDCRNRGRIFIRMPLVDSCLRSP
tara:strand:- start:175 stop:417 length:243 start_codon:yes stop_codon:yes gene_type:complete